MAKTETTPEVRRGVTDEDRKVYSSLAEAQANRPEGKPKWFCFQITDASGKVQYVWSPYYERALWWVVVDHDKSYSAIALEDMPSKADILGYLASLTPDDRAEVLSQFASKKGK